MGDNFVMENYEDLPVLVDQVKSVISFAESRAKEEKDKKCCERVKSNYGPVDLVEAYHHYVKEAFWGSPDWISPYDFMEKEGINRYLNFCANFINTVNRAIQVEGHIIDAIKEGYFDNEIIGNILN